MAITVTRTAVITEEQNMALEALAERRVCSVSLLIRAALQQYIEQHADELPVSFFGEGDNHNRQITTRQ